jgi:hypothetical protein
MIHTEQARADLAEAVRGLQQRSGARLLVAFLLLTTCALFLHLQSAKERCEFLFNTTHVVHGDLEVETERPARTFWRVISSSPVVARAVTARSAGMLSVRAFHTFARFLPLFDLTKLRLMRHLARRFRAPPAL